MILPHHLMKIQGHLAASSDFFCSFWLFFHSETQRLGPCLSASVFTCALVGVCPGHPRWILKTLVLHLSHCHYCSTHFHCLFLALVIALLIGLSCLEFCPFCSSSDHLILEWCPLTDWIHFHLPLPASQFHPTPRSLFQTSQIPSFGMDLT